MSFLDLTSYNSFYRGLEYCQPGCVISYEKVSDTIYKGIVRGSKDYNVSNTFVKLDGFVHAATLFKGFSEYKNLFKYRARFHK